MAPKNSSSKSSWLCSASRATVGPRTSGWSCGERLPGWAMDVSRGGAGGGPRPGGPTARGRAPPPPPTRSIPGPSRPCKEADPAARGRPRLGGGWCGRGEVCDAPRDTGRARKRNRPRDTAGAGASFEAAAAGHSVPVPRHVLALVLLFVLVFVLV